LLIDRARIYVKAGDGGRGSMSFRREKYVPMGGPDGGDGGKGGDVRLVVQDNITSLLAFQFNQHFKAQNGQAGMSRQKSGKQGATLDIDVPPGTVVHDDETGELIADLVEPGDSFVVAQGGKGGLGNIHFKSSIRRTPKIAELGEPGIERWIRLELRIIADVGLVGLPNAGKSTLLSAASAARPKIADYPFTTLEPNLGVVQIGGAGGQTYVMADVPGLIEGAAGGAGLGHDFLRHITRTKALVHVLDASGGLEGRNPLDDFKAIMDELEAFDPTLLKRPMVVALNKIDLPEAHANLKRLRAAMKRRNLPVFEISAATGDGVPDLLHAVGAILREIKAREKEIAKAAADVPKIYTLKAADERAWEVTELGPHAWAITGAWIERFTKMTNFDLEEGVDRYQSVLDRLGISAELTRRGVEDGDIVHVAGRELTWGDQDLAEPAHRRRTAAERLANRKR
jgi:GTP-binding protein